ncbi:voltage-dependent calcium channel subunit alpha-2/delta-1-like isoform X2 [Diadema antillarum]|uniref:voltage-dependent calcium channel subunit alpha-2/delta-1-like isoform X2 n=1 Tax=Diadema antillarum TaxID=105358 RepID=UPI003A8B38A5
MRPAVEYRTFVLAVVLSGFACDIANGQDPDDEKVPPLASVELWTEALSRQLTSALDNVTQINALKELYRQENLTTVTIDGVALINDVADKWQAILQKKMTAVRKIVDKLERSFAAYENDPDITQEDVSYPNSKNLTGVELNYDDRFKSDVNLNQSSVQIPTDIYKGDKVILNGIQATEDVDSVFLENFEEDPQLLWQYFGSADGFYRSYPAKEWVSAGDQDKDQYDVRRRGWYIQATSSPKDVMILVDTSGSTFGMTLAIMKVSVSKALDTLGNDDFVRVAAFNDSVQDVSCFDTFVQANLRNKEVLKDAVQTELVAKGIADFGKSLEYAFTAFSNFSAIERQGAEANNQGADCIRIIMIFTDGGTSKEEAIFKKYNSNPFVARVFVYKVGADSMVSSDGIKHMACTNRGYFSTIQSFGAVRLTTLDYVPVVSRPMVLSGHKNFQWSDIYLDALGLGMMTTLTLPVYNTSTFIVPDSDNITAKSQQLLGVVGTDITTKNMADTVPKNKPAFNSTFSQAIGPQAYVFGINSNGYILLHPRLKAELNYLSDPPNVDFLEVEFTTDEKLELRRSMIDRQNGTVTFETPLMSRDERYMQYVNMTYSYTFIDNTTFSVAIAQPSFDLKQYRVKSLTKSDATQDLQYIQENSETFFLIAPWVFCEELQDGEGDIPTENISNVIRINIGQAAGSSVPSTDKIQLPNCDDDMVNKLLIDGKITSNLADEWAKQESTMVDNGFLYVLAATQGGLTRFFPKTIPMQWTEEEKKNIQDPWEQDYYQRSLYTDKYVFSVPYNSGEGFYDYASEYIANITISKAVFVGDVVPAVVGVLMDPAFFNDSWTDVTSLGFNNRMLNFSCADVDLNCYILDDGGFVIASNQADLQASVGRFLGELDGEIMGLLLDDGVYLLNSTVDYQAACPRVASSDSAGVRSWFVPTLTDVINFNFWAANALWHFVYHTIADFMLFGWSDLPSSYAETIEQTGNVSCIKIIKNFHFGPNMSAEGKKECYNCTRSWVTSEIKGTNLLMLVTDAQCDGCPNEPVVQKPQEPSDDEAPDPCVLVREPRYRRRPSENCYNYSSEENDTICHGIPTASSSPWLLLNLYICSVVIAWASTMSSS